MKEGRPRPISKSACLARQRRTERIARQLGFVGHVEYLHVYSQAGGAQYGRATSPDQDLLLVSGALVKLPGQMAILLNAPPDYQQTRFRPDDPEDKGLEDKASVSSPRDTFRTELRGGKGRGLVVRNRT